MLASNSFVLRITRDLIHLVKSADVERMRNREVYNLVFYVLRHCAPVFNDEGRTFGDFVSKGIVPLAPCARQ